MSLETDVAGLVTQTTKLIDYFNSKKAGIDAAVAAAIAAVPAMSKNVYVDPIAGLDTNDGSLAAPLKTIDKALSNTPAGGICTVSLVNDYTMTGTITANVQLLHIRSAVSGTKRKLNIPYYLQEEAYRLPGFTFGVGGVIMMTDIVVPFPSIAGLNPAPTAFYNSLFKTGSVGGIPLIAVKMSRCDVQSAADGTGSLFVRLSSAFTLMVAEVTFPAGFGGRYISGIPSGADPKAYSDIITNLTTL